MKEPQIRRESLQVKLIPAPVKRNSKHSGSSTRNTNQLESKGFNSPYMLTKRGNPMNGITPNGKSILIRNSCL